jgi:cation:H+ antiporter
VALVFGLVAVLFAYPARTGYIERRRGVVLLVLYIAYVVATLQVKAA